LEVVRVREAAVGHELDDLVATGDAPAAVQAHRADAFGLLGAGALDLGRLDRRPRRPAGAVAQERVDRGRIGGGGGVPFDALASHGASTFVCTVWYMYHTVH